MSTLYRANTQKALSESSEIYLVEVRARCRDRRTENIEPLSFYLTQCAQFGAPTEDSTKRPVMKMADTFGYDYISTEWLQSKKQTYVWEDEWREHEETKFQF